MNWNVECVAQTGNKHPRSSTLQSKYELKDGVNASQNRYPKKKANTLLCCVYSKNMQCLRDWGYSWPAIWDLGPPDLDRPRVSLGWTDEERMVRGVVSFSVRAGERDL